MQNRTAEILGKLITSLAVLTFLLGACADIANGQVDIQEVAPPPLRLVSKEEQAQLTAVTDVKRRTQLALDLMSARLTSAEKFIEQDDLDEMYKQLGGFHGLMDNTLTFLDKSDSSSRKVLNNYKRFEMGLRQFRPRLELIRRAIPLSHEPYVRNLINYVRDARSKAVAPFFSDTVVPNRSKP